MYPDNDHCTAYDTFLNILESQLQECLLLKKIKIKAYTSDWLSNHIYNKSQPHLRQACVRIKFNTSTNSNCLKIVTFNGVPALGIRKMSLPAMRPNILSLKHLSLLCFCFCFCPLLHPSMCEAYCRWGGGGLEWVVESTAVTHFQCRLMGYFTSPGIDTR